MFDMLQHLFFPLVVWGIAFGIANGRINITKLLQFLLACLVPPTTPQPPINSNQGVIQEQQQQQQQQQERQYDGDYDAVVSKLEDENEKLREDKKNLKVTVQNLLKKNEQIQTLLSAKPHALWINEPDNSDREETSEASQSPSKRHTPRTRSANRQDTKTNTTQVAVKLEQMAEPTSYSSTPKRNCTRAHSGTPNKVTSPGLHKVASPGLSKEEKKRKQEEEAKKAKAWADRLKAKNAQKALIAAAAAARE